MLSISTLVKVKILVETLDKVLLTGLKEGEIGHVGIQSLLRKVTDAMSAMRIIISDKLSHNHKQENLSNHSSHHVIENLVGKDSKSEIASGSANESLSNLVIADHDAAIESKQLRTAEMSSSRLLYQMYQIALEQTD